jgi:hypothetical protein
MPRARTLKYEFFRNEALGYMPPHARLLFAGLWCLADREGRLEDRPVRMKLDLFGYDSNVTPETIDDLLALLDDVDLIRRYRVDGVPYIAVVKWSKHQHPHPREVASEIPAPPKDRPRHGHGHAHATPKNDQGDAKAMNGHDQGNAKDISSRAGSSFPSGSSMPSGSSGSSGSTDPPLRSVSSPAPRLKPRAKNATRGERLARDWRLPAQWGEWAMHECGMTRPQVEDQALRFADYWHAQPGQRASKLDWLATWRNWCRKARDDGVYRVPPRAAALAESRRHTAEAFGIAPRDRDVIDLPPDECHVIGPKH